MNPGNTEASKKEEAGRCYMNRVKNNGSPTPSPPKFLFCFICFYFKEILFTARLASSLTVQQWEDVLGRRGFYPPPHSTVGDGVSIVIE